MGTTTESKSYLMTFSFSIVTCEPPNYCCKKSRFGCSGRCIPDVWIKDGNIDCEDGSDELKGNY